MVSSSNSLMLIKQLQASCTVDSENGEIQRELGKWSLSHHCVLRSSGVGWCLP